MDLKCRFSFIDVTAKLEAQLSSHQQGELYYFLNGEVLTCEHEGGRRTPPNYHIEITAGHTALPEPLNHSSHQASSFADFDTELPQCMQLTHCNDHDAN